MSFKGNLLPQLTCETIYSGQNHNTKHWGQGNWNDAPILSLLTRILTSEWHYKLGYLADSVSFWLLWCRIDFLKRLLFNFFECFCFKSIMNHNVVFHVFCKIKVEFLSECMSNDLFDFFNKYTSFFLHYLFLFQNSCQVILWTHYSIMCLFVHRWGKWEKGKKSSLITSSLKYLFFYKINHEKNNLKK